MLFEDVHSRKLIWKPLQKVRYVLHQYVISVSPERAERRERIYLETEQQQEGKMTICMETRSTHNSLPKKRKKINIHFVIFYVYHLQVYMTFYGFGKHQKVEMDKKYNTVKMFCVVELAYYQRLNTLTI